MDIRFEGAKYHWAPKQEIKDIHNQIIGLAFQDLDEIIKDDLVVKVIEDIKPNTGGTYTRYEVYSNSTDEYNHKLTTHLTDFAKSV